jgi:hypothetical protein
MKIVEVISPWSLTLRDAREIAAYIESVSSAYVDEEQIEEYLGRRASAVLKTVPVSWLRPGNADANLRDARKERRYAKMNPQTIPPLVAWGDGQIIDGNHRYRVAVASGASLILCYVVS